MAVKKEIERIKPFKNDQFSIWYCSKHWRIIEGTLTLCAGGLFEQSEYDHVYKYFQSKKLI